MKQVKENLVKNIKGSPSSSILAWDRVFGGLGVTKSNYGSFQPWVDDSQEDGWCSGV